MTSIPDVVHPHIVLHIQLTSYREYCRELKSGSTVYPLKIPAPLTTPESAVDPDLDADWSRARLEPEADGDDGGVSEDV